jgi:phage baseplate assembly protein W
MAYKNLVITPPKYTNQDTNKNSQFYRGFSTVDATSSSVTLFDRELIKQDLLNNFNIRKGESLMNPNFGTIIWDVIYEPLTYELKDSLKEDITAILKNDPRVNILTVNVVEQDFGILLEITLTYVDTDQTENISLKFDKTSNSVFQ